MWSAFLEPTVDAKDRAVVFAGRGWGHGAGMCQYGAESLARAGRTIDETRQVLIERYKEYFKEPLVSVRVTSIHSDRVFVLGEVQDPAAFELVGPTTLTQAIAQAGGFEEEFANKSEVRIVRKGPDDQPYVQVVNLDAVLAGRAEDPSMRRGDVVWVPARGVTNFNRDLGQALAPFSIALGVVGASAAIITAAN